jgi:hypothetical protein
MLPPTQIAILADDGKVGFDFSFSTLLHNPSLGEDEFISTA